MCTFIMFITAVCVLFLIKLRWPRNKSLYDKVNKLARNGYVLTKLRTCKITSNPTNTTRKPHELTLRLVTATLLIDLLIND